MKGRCAQSVMEELDSRCSSSIREPHVGRVDRGVHGYGIWMHRQAARPSVECVKSYMDSVQTYKEQEKGLPKAVMTL